MLNDVETANNSKEKGNANENWSVIIDMIGYIRDYLQFDIDKGAWSVILLMC
jgi:hypothetical protein